MGIIGNRGNPPAMGVWVQTRDLGGGWLMLHECDGAPTKVSNEAKTEASVPWCKARKLVARMAGFRKD